MNYVMLLIMKKFFQALISTIAILATVILFFTCYSNAYSFRIPSNKQIVERAKLFGKGRIVTRKAFTYKDNEKTDKIGWILKVQIMESWKGTTGFYKIVDFNGNAFHGFDHDYVFIANEVTDIKNDMISSTAPLFDIQYSLGNSQQTIFLLDPLAKKIKGEEWMVITTEGYLNYSFSLTDKKIGTFIEMPLNKEVLPEKDTGVTSFTFNFSGEYPNHYYVRSLSKFIYNTLER